MLCATIAVLRVWGIELLQRSHEELCKDIFNKVPDVLFKNSSTFQKKPFVSLCIKLLFRAYLNNVTFDFILQNVLFFKNL